MNIEILTELGNVLDTCLIKKRIIRGILVSHAGIIHGRPLTTACRMDIRHNNANIPEVRSNTLEREEQSPKEDVLCNGICNGICC